MTNQAARARVPAGVPSGGQWTTAPRAEPRLRLVVLNPPGLSDADTETFRRIDAQLVDGKPLTALDKMTYSRLATTIDDHLDPDDLSDRMQIPDCPGCGQTWGRPRRPVCRVCTDGLGDPLPLEYRLTLHHRLGAADGDRQPRPNRGVHVR